MDHSTVKDTPPGERYLTVKRVGDKLSRRKSFIYNKLATDQNSPKPLRWPGGYPVFKESDIDACVLEATRNAKSPSPGARFKKGHASVGGGGRGLPRKVAG